MSLIDFILNVAGVLLWLNWRSLGFDPLAKTMPATLVGTLRPTERNRWRGWQPLCGLAALLFFRALLYWQLGAAVDWTPSLHLGAIVVPFRSDYFGRILVFSVLSFGVAWAFCYLWLLLLSLVNGRAAEAEPLQRLVRLHLGVVDRWPWAVKLLLPWLVTFVAWFGLSFLLVGLKVIPPAVSVGHRLQQAIVIGLSVYLTWKFLIGALLMLRLLSSYIYLGDHWFWRFVALTGRQLLTPLQWAPLQLGKVDFAPVLAIAVVFLAAEFAERGLTVLYERLPI